jgi:hypothetical protein
MNTFIAIHQVTPHIDTDSAARMVYGVIKRLKPDTQWLRYWLSDDTGRMFCLWSAPNADAVWEIVRAAGVPTESVYQVEEGDPSLLMQGLDK